MGRQFLPVDRDAPALLPVNMLDWVPEDHVVRLVIDTVEAVASPELTARLVPAVRSRKGRRRYDPVMLLTLLAYAYLRGVLSSRAIEDRCRYDVTFRVACGKLVPDHVTIARFRKLACTQDGLMEELFYAVLAACASAGLGRLTVIACDGVKIGANASKEANRTEAGLGKLAARIIADAAAAEEADAAGTAPPAAADLLGGEKLPRGWADPRSRAGRITACLEDLTSAREAAEAAARAAGQDYLDALAAGTAAGRPPAQVTLAAQQIRVEQAIAAQQELIADWETRRAAGQGSRLGRRPVAPDDAGTVRRARGRLADLAAAQAQAEADTAASGDQDKKPARNITDPDSRLVPVRGGALKQGYNCQDAAAGDRLMLGGYPCEGRATYKRRAPDVEGLHASLEDRIRLRTFSLRGLTAVTGEFLLAGLCRNLLLLLSRLA